MFQTPLYFVSLGFSVFLFFACQNKKQKETEEFPNRIKVEWVNELTGDFSFKDQWDYPFNVFKNEFGQLSCDGFCPGELERMKDSNGKILTDSLGAFYRLLDTTHQFHSIQCEAWCYEWAGTNYMETIRKGKDSLQSHTLCNPGTHCSLILDITNDTCFPKINLASIVENGNSIFYCTKGFIKAERSAFNTGIFKVIFDLKFLNTTDSLKSIYWKGKIFSKINRE